MLSPENKNYALIDNVLFDADLQTLVAYPGGLTESEYKIPEGTVKIGGYAFALCNNLTGITIPESVTEIGNSAFSNCFSLTSVTIPDSVTEIGDMAFTGCSSLTDMTIPESVTEIRSGTFSFCTGLASIKIPESVTEINNLAFINSDNLKLIVERDSYAAQFAEENGILYAFE